MKTDYTNLGHLSDKELDVCECSDPQCGSCFGQCHNPATVTLYRVDMEDLTGERMCEDCASDAMESGVFRTEEDDEEDDEEDEPAPAPMKTRTIERYYPDQDKTLFLLVEEKIQPKYHTFTELARGDTFQEVEQEGAKRGYPVPEPERWVYPDWPAIDWYYSL